MILDVLLISVIVCFVIDISGFVITIKKAIWKWLRKDKPFQDYSLKPFDCSLCSIWWCGLLWLIIQGDITLLNVFIVCLFALLSEQISNILRLIQFSIQSVLDTIITKIK